MEAFLLAILVGSASGIANEHEDETLLAEIKQYKEYRKNLVYHPNWKSLDSRPMPHWYDQAKFGILIHWGVYSVPAFHSEWFWKHWMNTPKEAHDDKFMVFMENYFFEKDPHIKYEDFADMFKAEKFEPDVIATILQDAGAKYVVLSGKHHDGFTLFPSLQAPNWNAMEVGPHRDLVADIALSVRKKNMAFGIQYSMSEWYNIWYINDKEGGFNNSVYPVKRVWPELTYFVYKYAPSIIRAHGDYEGTLSYWKPEEFLAWLYNKSPARKSVVVNDRFGSDARQRHGDFYNYVNETYPKHLPHKWEIVIPLDTKSWGYRRDLRWKDLVPLKKTVKTIVDAVSRGGNVLLNIGLTRHGKLPKIFKKQLGFLGQWLKVNGEGIYDTSPWVYSSDSFNKDVRYTCKKLEYNAAFPTEIPQPTDTVTAIYAFFSRWPTNRRLILEDIAHYFRNNSYVTTLLGYDGPNLKWTWIKGKIAIELPEVVYLNKTMVYDLGWTLKFVRVLGVPVRGEIFDTNISKYQWNVDVIFANHNVERTELPLFNVEQDNYIKLPRD